MQYLHCLLSSVLPVVKQIHHEQCSEVELERKLRGKKLLGFMMAYQNYGPVCLPGIGNQIGLLIQVEYISYVWSRLSVRVKYPLDAKIPPKTEYIRSWRMKYC